MALHPYQKQMYMRIGIITALIILPIAGFFVGIQYQKQTGGGTTTAQLANGRLNGNMMRDRAFGTVKSIDNSNITITERRTNTDKTYTLTSSTTYQNNTVTAAAADVKTGDTIMLTLDSSDNTKVTTVTINPTFERPAAQNSSDPTLQ
jgi:hypothetical protein